MPFTRPASNETTRIDDDRPETKPVPQRGSKRIAARISHAKPTRPQTRGYCASSAASSHSVLRFSPGTSNATWANHPSAAAPCQCFTPGATNTASPGRRGANPFPILDTTHVRRCTAALAHRLHSRDEYASYCGIQAKTSRWKPPCPLLLNRSTDSEKNRL